MQTAVANVQAITKYVFTLKEQVCNWFCKFFQQNLVILR